VSASFKFLHNSKCQSLPNLYQWMAFGRGFSDTIVPLSISVLVVQVGAGANYHFRGPRLF